MARRYVVQVGDEVLRKKCDEVKSFNKELCVLLDDMKETVRAENGAGLAAPQIGLSIKLIVVDATPFAEEEPKCADFKKALMNPEIYATEGEEWAFEEGCLSFPGLHEDVMRPETVHIRYQDIDGTPHDEVYDGYVARILQHECDHLNGKTFVDHLSSLRKTFLRRKLDNIVKGAVSVDYKMRFPNPKHR